MPVWQLFSARLTVFVAPDTTVSSALWRDLVGEEPEQSVFQRSLSTRVETGEFADGKLTLQVQPTRVDWLYEAVAPMADTPLLGVFPAAAEPLLQLGRQWMRANSFPAAQRIALGAALHAASPDLQTGYRELRQFIEGVPTTPDATDFQLQVNRPRPSRSIEGLSINRLSKWSVGAVRTLTIAAGHPAPAFGEYHYHLRLELDVNTSPEFVGTIDGARAEAVLDDLFAGAREISEQGNRF